MTTGLSARISSRLNRFKDGYKSLSSLRRQMAGKVTCLLYHRVAASDDHPWIERGGVPATSPHAFQQQLRLLKRIGCRFFTFKQLVAGQFPASDQPGVVVTFDDGFADNFQVARQMLDSAGIPAVFFVASGIVAASECNWDHQICWYLSQSAARETATKLVAHIVGSAFGSRGVAWAWRHLLTPVQVHYVLESLRQQFGAIPKPAFRNLYCNWDDLRTAVTAGHEIGSHTVNHPMRHTLTLSECEAELVGSKQCLERHLRCPVTSLSFPFNSYLFSDAEVCQQYGYTAVATVEPGRLTRKTSLLDIPRRTIFRMHDHISAFKALLAQERWQ